MEIRFSKPLRPRRICAPALRQLSANSAFVRERPNMRLPAGVRDWLPHELARKRDMEVVIRAVFGRWAYEEVQTPTFERFDVLEKGLGHELTEQAYRFADRRATALALRPDMTTPIARLVSTRMRDVPLPLRLSYIAPAYRYEEPQEGRMREFTQAG